MTAQERKTVELALGRIFRMGSRPGQPGDVAEYYRCRDIVMGILQPEGFGIAPDYTHDYGRDRLKGAAGDF